MYTRGRPKSIFHFGRKRKCRRLWNSIYGPKRNENRHSFPAEKRKRKSPDNSVFFLFHTFSHQVSPTMRRQTWHRDTSFFVNNGAILLKLPAAADGTVSTTVCWNTRQTMARIQPRVTSQFVSDEILSYIRNKEAASKLRLRCTLFWRC